MKFALKTKKNVKLLMLISPIFFVFFFTLFLISSSFAIIDISESSKKLAGKVNENLYSLFSSRPKVLGSISQRFGLGDPRVVIIKQFFQNHQAPLSDYAETIVKEADNAEAALSNNTVIKGIDWRLVPAIAMCESNGGKKIPIYEGKPSNNAWGWAASEKALQEKTGEYVLGSWEDAIAKVTRGLAKGYYHLIDLSDGAIDFEDLWKIMEKYAPPSVEKGGPWAKCVWQYYQELTEFKTPTTTIKTIG